jgi:2-polyprenyl-6-hydroxyphenyl methylase / 3-demethylubiquinone-9 3-methyltransferase
MADAPPKPGAYNGPLSVESGDYARKQIYCPSRVVAWSHGSRFRLAARLAAERGGRRLLDYGCGDGTFIALTEGAFASATGADVDAKQLAACDARLGHLNCVSFVSTGALEGPGHSGAYDVVTCMEVLEHIPQPADHVAACVQLLKPGGHAIFATINRNPKSFLFAIVGAEYVLNLLPRGTHQYAKFIRPSELAAWCRAAGLTVERITGMTYNPLTRIYALGSDTDVNYMLAARIG